VFSAYEVISTLRCTSSNLFYPKVRAVADECAGGVVSHTNQLTNYAKAYLKPACDYYEKKNWRGLGGIANSLKTDPLGSDIANFC